MDTIIKKNKILGNKFVLVLILFTYLLLLLPFLGNVAFDAVVHFVVAENFSNGHPFVYNLNDTEKVIASTSPFWTILLTFFYYIAGQFAPLIVKTVCILLWFACGYLLNIVSRDIWKLKDYTRLAVLVMWFANVSIVKNSLGGLENVLSAFQLLLLYYFLWRKLESTSGKTNFIIGALLGWTILTRIDAGVLAMIFVLIYLFVKAGSRKSNFVSSVFTIVLVCLVVLLPWYLYQYSYTSKILSDSSLARLFTGRRNSYTLINGFVYFHPSAITILFSAFLPVSIGFLLTLFKSKLKNLKENFHIISALIIVLCCVLAYSFIIGADQFGRYFLICIAFFLLSGFYGMQYIYSYFKDRNAAYLNVLIALLIIFLFLANAYDYYKRVVNIEQIESNIYEIFFAPSMRGNLTSEALQKYGYDTNDTIKLAITEVQYKYFVDKRIHVISLDGRSSPRILKYMNEKGLPDFEKFIENEKPDIVEVKGWPYRGNLLYDWEEKINGMKIGESFNWKSNTVTYISRWHVKILYNTNR